MKKANILDFFKSPRKVIPISCPACGALVPESKLNEHLDALCSTDTTSNINGSCDSSLKPSSSKSKPSSSLKMNSKRTSSTSNRLSLKTQRKVKSQKTLKCFSDKTVKEVIEVEDDDVILLEEINSPVKQASTFQNSASACNKDESSKQALTLEHATNVPSTANNHVTSKLSRRRNMKRHVLVSENEDNDNEVSACKDSDVEESTSNKAVLFTKRRKSSRKKSISSINRNSKTEQHNNVIKIISSDHTVAKASSFGNNVAGTTSQCVNEEVSELEEIQVIEPSMGSCKADTLNTAKSSSSDANVIESTSQDEDEKPFEFACPANRIQREGDKIQATSIETISHFDDRKTPEFVSSAEYVQGVEDKFQVTSVNKNVSESSIKRNSSNVLSPSSDIANILRDAKIAMENDSLFSELSDDHAEEVQSSQNTKPYAPYYIANFKHIVDTVLSEEENQNLFNKEDRDSIAAFKAQDDAAQKLYVRLFQRKYKWLRANKINYPEITNNPGKTLEELVSAGLVDSGSMKIELEVALDLLSLPETKSLAKHFNFHSGKNKSEIKQMFLKHCKEHKSVFFMNSSNSIANAVLKKVKQIMGPCYRISLLPKRLFTRILMLFSLPTISEDDDEAAGGQQQQLLTLLQVNKGELVFPDYKRTKKTVIFCDRDELIRYEEARQLENDIYNAVENKNFELAKDLYINAEEEFDEQCSCSFADRASSLPVFLKRYTSFHVYIRCMTQGVEVLQKLRQYKEAVVLLKRLLKQKVFCQDYSGRWYDRLALNLNQHLKQPDQAIEAIKKGLKNPNVRVGHRYSLLTRALRITKSWDESDQFRNLILKEASVKDAPKVIIKGRLCPRTILGRRHVFISSSSVATDEDDVSVLGVEQLSIEHYLEEGFSEGIHGEGSTFISLYSLLFWDIIYDGSIPDVFISPYQTHPLDLNSEDFFKNRENQILSHLDTLRASTIEELREIVKSTWEAHHGQTSLVSWDRFRDVEHVQGLVSCMGNDILCGICERLARDFRFTRSGVPDLVVWNPDTLCVKIVEVKGPGDKLSSKQILWLDYLLTLGADAEVCLVEAVASKKLRKLES